MLAHVGHVAAQGLGPGLVGRCEHGPPVVLAPEHALRVFEAIWQHPQPEGERDPPRFGAVDMHLALVGARRRVLVDV